VTTMSPGYFRDLYAASADPWGMADRWYEARKYATSVALLPRERYASAFEPGCSIGVLTTHLASRCDRLLACDTAAAAVESAAARTAGLPGVRVEQRALPGQWPPDASFDLIVLSEVLYYFGDADLEEMLRLSAGALRLDGHLLAVHWRHDVPDYPRTGDSVHEALAACGGLARLARYQDPDFTAEVYARADGDRRSVAQATGIA
jgi:trans-aconitate methyltransferase